MVRRLLIASLASLSLGGCISYPGDGYYSAPGNAYYGNGDDDGYYGSPGYYGDYSYGNIPRVSISFSFGSGFPYYGYPSYYGYSRCSAWSPYCFGGFYPSYGYGWGGYWPVYGYNNHHHHPHYNPKPRPPGHRPDGPDRPGYNADGPDRPGHGTDYPIGVRPDGQRPRAGQRPDRPVPAPINEYTQPIAVGDTPEARPLPPQQRPRRMPLPIIIEDGREMEFRRADWIPPQTPIRAPARQRPIPVESGDGQYVRIPGQIRAVRPQQPQAPRSRAEQPETDEVGYVRFTRAPRDTSVQQGQPDRPNSRQPISGAPVIAQQGVPQRTEPKPQPPARARAESAPREPKAKTVRDDGDEP